MDSGDHIKKDHTLLGKRLIGQLQLIITVLDIERLDKYSAYIQYTRAIAELLQLLNYGLPHPIHNTVEVKRWPRLNSKVLKSSRFYLILFIL